MFHRERGQMQLSVVDVVNHGIMAEPEASAELAKTLREADGALQMVYKGTVSRLWNCYVEMLREVNEALQIAYERTVSELRNCYVEMLREVNEATGGVEPFSELVAAVESNNLLKEYGSPTYGRAVGFSLN